MDGDIYWGRLVNFFDSTGHFLGQNSKMAKLAKTAVIAGPRAGIFEISKFLSKKLRLLPKNHPRAAWLPDLTVSSFVPTCWSNGNAPRSTRGCGFQLQVRAPDSQGSFFGRLQESNPADLGFHGGRKGN